MFDLKGIKQGFREDLPGFVCGLLAGPILYFGFAIASLIGAPPV
jgi:hypothetical protein